MLALGIILILLAVGAFVAVLGSGTDEQATLFGGNVELPTLVVFLAGAVAMLLFIMGLELARSGVRRANENRRTKKRLRTLEQRGEGRGGSRSESTLGSGDAPRDEGAPPSAASEPPAPRSGESAPPTDRPSER